MSEPKPIAWALLNPATGGIDLTYVFRNEENARTRAAARTSRWRVMIAVPLYLHPE